MILRILKMEWDKWNKTTTPNNHTLIHEIRD